MVFGLLLMLAALSASAPPESVAVQGQLRNQAGIAVDGAYQLLVTLHDAQNNGNALWSQTFDDVEIGGGVFHLALEGVGTEIFANTQAVWVGIKVEGEPELDRVRLLSTPLALVAAKALGLDCSGCVSQSALDFEVVTSDAMSTAIANATQSLATTDALAAAVAPLATTAALDAAVAPLATTAALDAAVAPLATTTALDAAVAPLATTAALDAAVSSLATAAALAAFLPKTGGEVSGDLRVSGAFELGDTDVAKATCDAEAAGVLAFDDGTDRLYYCDGAKWRRLTTCDETCPAPETVPCNQQIKNNCGDAGCPGVGSQCAIGDCTATGCTSPTGTTPDFPGGSCGAVRAAGQNTDGEYWLQWPGLPAPTKVYCNQTADFGTGVVGGWMAYCHPTLQNIASKACGNIIPYASLKAVPWTEHVWQSLPDGWWMHLVSDQSITNNGSTCTATLTVKSDIGNWGKTQSPQLNSLTNGTCGGNGGCWWGNQGNCNSGGIHLRGSGSQSQGGSGDTMTNGWNQITHGGGLGGGNGGKHTNFGAGGTANSASNWAGFLR